MFEEIAKDIMPKEENPVELVPVEETNETNEAASTQDVSPAVEAPADKYDVAAFEEAFPAFRGQKVSADIREKLWQNLAMANVTAAKSRETESPSRPTIRELPPIDLKSVTQRMLEASEAGDTEAVLKAQQEIVNFQGCALESLSDFAVRNEWDTQQMSARIDGLEKPQLLRQAGQSVEGFQDSDIAAAQKLMNDGVTQDPHFAVRFAVTDRLVKTNSAQPLSAQEKADRVARAAVAASAPSSQTSGSIGEPLTEISFNSPNYQARMKEELRAKLKQT